MVSYRFQLVLFMVILRFQVIKIVKYPRASLMLILHTPEDIKENIVPMFIGGLFWVKYESVTYHLISKLWNLTSLGTSIYAIYCPFSVFLFQTSCWSSHLKDVCTAFLDTASSGLVVSDANTYFLTAFKEPHDGVSSFSSTDQWRDYPYPSDCIKFAFEYS